MKKTYNVGDTVTTYIKSNTNSGEKLKVVGKVKKFRVVYGKKTYTITGGIVQDFNSRSVK